MNEIEKILKEKKLEIDNLVIPDELELRLKNKLNEKTSKKPIKNIWKIKIAALFLVIILISYNIDILAFYGKKLIGYNELMDSTLKELNESGKGQVIGKNYKFKNGLTVTLDGIMIDDNQLLAFYTIKDPNKRIDELNSVITGIFGKYYMHSGQGNIDENENKVQWIASFESPRLLEKKLTWNFSLTLDGKEESGSIEFILDRNKAMGSTLKKHIYKSIEIDKNEISFDSISASPTTTVLNGTIQNILELVMDQINHTRFRPQSLDIKLIANGKELDEKTSGISTDMKGIKFYKEYEALPKNLENLKIRFISFGADYDVNQQVNLKNFKNNQSIKVLNQNIKINTIYESKGETYITITTKKDVLLSRVYLILDGEKIELKETISSEYAKMPDGTINHTRTLRFSSTGNDLKLDIKQMKYNKIYEKLIDIPIS